MTDIEKLTKLASDVNKQGENIKKVEEAVKIELAKSQASQSVKDALLERIVQGVRDNSGTKAIIGIETPKKNNHNEVLLPNGFRINLDALT